MRQKQSSQYVIGFSYEKSVLQDTGIDNVFFLEISCRKMYTIFSAVQRQQRKSDVMTSFGLAACSAVYYQVPHCLRIDCERYLFRAAISKVVDKYINCDRQKLKVILKVVQKPGAYGDLKTWSADTIAEVKVVIGRHRRNTRRFLSAASLSPEHRRIASPQSM
jgi:hypothetical protein